MDELRIQDLEKKAYEIRITGLKMVQYAGSGHLGGAFSLSEIMSCLYFEKMNIRPEEPDWFDRDRFVLSKGHGTVALYPTLALRGYFPVERLKEFRKTNGMLSGHAEMRHVPGVDMSTGSLGQGLSAAVGMAIGGKILGKDFRVYCIVGDGELDEGQIWEASMAASKYKLDNLIVIVDSNKVQLDGTVKEIMDTGDLSAKFHDFGYDVQSINGHDIAQIAEAVDNAVAHKGSPNLILANTIKGKGVSFMEGKAAWHGKLPNANEFTQAFAELETAYNKLGGVQ